MIGTYITPACPRCGVKSALDLDVAKVARWTQGEYIQTVWPDMSADRRELLITGYHDACWDLDLADHEALNAEAVN